MSFRNNIVIRLQRWMDSVPGQTFLNYAYSWGASIVILGTLFKLTHLPGANLMLFMGMGTEVFVFFLSAFDRPFDKTEVGKVLPKGLPTEEEIRLDINAADLVCAKGEPIATNTAIAGAAASEGLVFGGGQPQYAAGDAMSGNGHNASSTLKGTDGNGVAADGQPIIVGNNWLQNQVDLEMEEATKSYVDELKNLTELLTRVSEQSQRLTRDSEEMEKLNRTLTGINSIYEMQLKGASMQIGTIDQINEQSCKMAQQIEQLNKIYSRMIEAMTVNMHAASPGVSLSNESNNTINR